MPSRKRKRFSGFGLGREQPGSPSVGPRLAGSSAALNRAFERVRLETLSILFDAEWYAAQLLAPSSLARHELVQDYLTNGALDLLSPHPLFDPKWYLEQNEDVRIAFEDGIDPFLHFLLIGSRENMWPHPLFDVAWYKDRYVVRRSHDVLTDFALSERHENRSTHPLFDADWYRALHIDQRTWQRPAIIHFVCRGIEMAYRPNRWSTYGRDSKLIAVDDRPYNLSTRPLVSIIIINHNGARFLSRLFDSLRRQSYNNFEIIFIDNNSADNSVVIAREHQADRFIILELDKNIGFAAANNAGLLECRGELIALLNNDTYVSDEWLSYLVSSMQQDENSGAVCPKIRFKERFCEVGFYSNQHFSIGLEQTLFSLDYKKIFVTAGRDEGGLITSISIEDHQSIILKVPFQTKPISVGFGTAGCEATIDCVIGHRRRSVFVRKGQFAKLFLEFSLHDQIQSFFVINNAGSIETGWLNPADRGYGGKDDGSFDGKVDIDYMCGCSVLIRRDALLGCTLFLAEFNAYFEDSELSIRLRRSGFNIVYCPDAIVYHHHSATAVEKSPFWKRHVYRNKTVFQFICTDNKGREELMKEGINSLEALRAPTDDNTLSASTQVESEILSEITSGITSMCDSIKLGSLKVQRIYRIGVFNEFWNTFGGGEAHALNICAYLQRYGMVELISTEDFDIDQLCRFFSHSAKPFIKRLVVRMQTSITSEYDVFVNASFMNECPSEATHSFFILSFPSRSPSPAFKKSYTFLSNSKYTDGWAQLFWGEDFHHTVLYPSISQDMINSQPLRKDKIILSVGRFFSSGHCKNQLQIAAAFRRLCETCPASRDWTLVLIGSVNDSTYLESVRAALIGLKHEIIIDADFEVVKDYYGRSAIYVHAAGFGRKIDEEPENFEHFGMTIAEAAANGCVPIVYNAAGPKEIVQLLEFGITFGTLDELDAALSEQVASFEPEKSSTLPLIDGKRLFSLELSLREMEQILSPAFIS